ncbi:MAG TPA: secretin N-terminal domain-containing protein [Gemmatimonadota bacterium]|nr:secretin N-terminal domain-containing protein [Gemmatimonadota bacterium]
MSRHRVRIVVSFAAALWIAGAGVALAQPISRVENFRVTSVGEATRIVIETSGDVRFREQFQPLPPNLTIELVGALPDLPLRSYDDIFRGGVRHVMVSAPTPNVVRFDIALAGVSSYAAYLEGTDLVLTFDNPTGSFTEYAARVRGPIAPPVQGVVTRRVNVPPGGGVEALATRDIEGGLPGIDGHPVTFSFQGADIHTVARAFAEVANRSIVVGNVGEIFITADIRNEPWDDALLAIMRAYGLDVRMSNGIIRIDSVERLREAETLLELETIVLNLNYVSAVDVRGVVEPLLSERGAVNADPKTNALVLTDVPERLRQVAGVISELDVRTPQVTIKAKIVFVNKIDLREMGVRWRAQNLGDPTVDTHVLAEADGRIADPFLDLSIGTLASGLNVGGLLQALEQRELADVQAEPQTTVLNNLTAEIFVGERTPIRVLDVGADSPQATASVQLIETGIILRVTPHITSAGKVLMRLHAERSGVAVTDPAVGVTFNTQRATSEILVDDGETAVIGGLTVQDVSNVRTGIPILKDIPILGGLFRSERRRSEKRDLLIFVTPYIVPVDQEPHEEVITVVCVEDQTWYRADEPVLHNGERWLKFGAPLRLDGREVIAVGNFRGVPVYTTVATAAYEIYLPLCSPGLYQPYRRVEAIRGTTG